MKSHEVFRSSSLFLKNTAQKLTSYCEATVPHLCAFLREITLARALVVNNQTFNIPDAGEDPGWGEETSDFLEEVSRVLGTLLGAEDIIETTVSLANNQSSAANIAGLLFDNAIVQGAIIEYSVIRSTDDVTYGRAETGLITAVYDANHPTNKWQLSQQRVGNAGVSLSINDTGSNGQFQYTTTNLAGANYAGQIVFKARAVLS